MSCPRKIRFYFVVTWLAFGLLVLVGQSSRAAQAGGLPPREAPAPRPGGEGKNDKDDPPAGATIELIVPGAPANGWATQWQDLSGGWHDVAGWRGHVADSSRWWVHPKDFGAGPFRWLVTQGAGGPPAGPSAPFTLPGGAGQVVRVTAP